MQQINDATAHVLGKKRAPGAPKSALRDAILAELRGKEVFGRTRIHERNGFVSVTHVPTASFGMFLRAAAAGHAATAKRR